eukprot:GHVR01043900.1.p1 GENE.GHVR01043900.1~~GHVR01043900.1.p1  ORF type:complete len:101 (-),score=11.90 GHVR01043900.1:2845-3147(-)
MDYLNSISESKIVIYDGNDIIPEWSDLITSGYLFVEGRKIILKNTVVMEMRNIYQCSPSFVGECQIVYLGNLISKVDKFKALCGITDDSSILETLFELFG